MWDAVAGAEKIYCSTGKSTTLKLGYAGYSTSGVAGQEAGRL